MHGWCLVLNEQHHIWKRSLELFVVSKNESVFGSLFHLLIESLIENNKRDFGRTNYEIWFCRILMHIGAMIIEIRWKGEIITDKKEQNDSEARVRFVIVKFSCGQWILLVLPWVDFLPSQTRNKTANGVE